MALAAYAQERLGLPLVFPEQTTFKEFAVHVGRPADEAIRAAREQGVHPGYALERDYAGLEDALLVCVTEKRTRADIDRLAEVLAGMKLIYELSQEGRGAPPLFPRTTCRFRRSPRSSAANEPPRLPELAEPELVRHFTRLSTRTFGIDTGFYPLGSCTMKHNPRVNERVVNLPGFRDLHPLQEEEGAQGALELMWRLQEILAEVAGLPAVSLQPAAGSQGELTGLMLMRAYFADRGEGETRRKIVIPDTAHGTNPASVTMTGYELTNVQTDARGNIDVDDLRGKVDEGTAGLMLTNPSTLGLFDENIEEITRIFHDAGALTYYDGANLNAVCGISRPGDMGFDIVHFNLHKTFSQPHGGGGPGGGPIAVRDDARAVPAGARGRARRRGRPFGSTTTGRRRSARCAASAGRSGSSSAPTRTSARTGPACARCPRSPCSTPTTCSPASRTPTSFRTTGSACTSSSSRRAA